MASCKAITLAIFNVLFLLLGIALVALGCYVKFGNGLNNEYLDDAFLKIVVEGAEMSLQRLIDLVCIIAICLGAFIIVLSSIGILGVCCQNKCLLATYAVITILLLIVQIVAVVFTFIFYNKLLKAELKGFMNETLYDTYTDNIEDPVTRGWNYMFFKFECCGVDSYLDVVYAKNYSAGTTGHTAPAFCCKNLGDSDFPELKPPANDLSLNCAKNPTPTISNYKTGCYQVFEDLVRDQVLVLAIIGVVVILIQLMVTVLAIFLCRDYGGEKLV